VSVQRLKEVSAQMAQVAALQRDGIIDVHTSAQEKRRLRRETLAGLIAHVSEVGGLAGRDYPTRGTGFGSRTMSRRWGSGFRCVRSWDGLAAWGQ
jgi:hypothetical protein